MILYLCRQAQKRYIEQKAIVDHSGITDPLAESIKKLAEREYLYNKARYSCFLYQSLYTFGMITAAGWAVNDLSMPLSEKNGLESWMFWVFLSIHVLLLLGSPSVRKKQIRYNASYQECKEKMDYAMSQIAKVQAWTSEINNKQGNKRKKSAYDRAENANIRRYIKTTTEAIDSTVEKTRKAESAISKSTTRLTQALLLPNIKTAIVTAHSEEYAALLALLDNPQKIKASGKGKETDGYIGYITGKDRKVHKVGLFLLPQSGNNVCGVYTAMLFEKFTRLQNLLICGIAGGIPSHEHLGDVVVSTNGIFQYEYGKFTGNEKNKHFVIRDYGAVCSPSMNNAVNHIRAHAITNVEWRHNIERIAKKLGAGFVERPEVEFFYTRENQEMYETKHCPAYPTVYYGRIASNDCIQCDPQKRDLLYKEQQVLAIEMEGAAIAESVMRYKRYFLEIRGISDFCDGAKNSENSMTYASATAASYTISLLQSMEEV